MSYPWEPVSVESTCPICGKPNCDAILDGDELVAYICSACGAKFWPTPTYSYSDIRRNWVATGEFKGDPEAMADLLERVFIFGPEYERPTRSPASGERATERLTRHIQNMADDLGVEMPTVFSRGVDPAVPESDVTRRIFYAPILGDEFDVIRRSMSKLAADIEGLIEDE